MIFKKAIDLININVYLSECLVNQWFKSVSGINKKTACTNACYVFSY